MPDNPEKDPRVYLAAERTLLAWIRSGLAMMGFGFVVARFGLFLRELQAVRPNAPVASPHGSLWFGTALVFLGVLVNLAAVFQHFRMLRELRQGTWDANHAPRLAMIVGVALAVVGLTVAVYLLTVQ